MKILALEDGLCVMTDIAKCLECGTCIRDCPQDAITIPGVKLSPKERMAPRLQRQRSRPPISRASQKFTPILQHLTDLIMKEIAPVQIFTHEGTDVTTLQEFDLEGESCFYRVYKADKLEKIRFVPS